MNNAEWDFRVIPINKIHIANPRPQDMAVLAATIKSISLVGLRKPITVNPRQDPDGEEAFDLVCGQGRLEAYVALGVEKIPAFVTSASRAVVLLMSLVEGLPRRRVLIVAPLRNVRSRSSRNKH